MDDPVIGVDATKLFNAIGGIKPRLKEKCLSLGNTLIMYPP